MIWVTFKVKLKIRTITIVWAVVVCVCGLGPEMAKYQTQWPSSTELELFMLFRKISQSVEHQCNYVDRSSRRQAWEMKSVRKCPVEQLIDLLSCFLLVRVKLSLFGSLLRYNGTDVNTDFLILAAGCVNLVNGQEWTAVWKDLIVEAMVYYNTTQTKLINA